MADWFHCNKCYARISSAGGAKFILTSCGHIFCDKCATGGNQKSCYICHSEYTSIVLTASLNPEVQLFFNDALESLKKITKVVEFQKNHAQKLFEHLDKQNKILQQKYDHSKEYIKKLTKEFESLQRDHARLRNLLKANIASPRPGSAFRGTPTGTGSTISTPGTLTSTPGNLNRSIIRGQTGWPQNGLNNNNNKPMINRSSVPIQQQNSAMFRQQSIYNDSPSVASVSTSSSIGGSRTSMTRGSGVPNRVGYSQASSTFNLSGLNFGGSSRHQPAGRK